MSKIRLLPDRLIAKIAAGEVIERPAYAVKELIDNAIDAGATSIKIEIEKSGLQKIVITDNGEGMTKEDLLESFKLHTTSKIQDDHNLVGIESLGFRGEALASIAVISDLSIKTKTQEATTGTHIDLKAGKIDSIGPVGMVTGTIVSVENLFHTVPVRKNFIKNLAYEFRLILDTVSDQALAHPNISFVLAHNNKVIFTLPKNQSLEERVKKLIGEDVINDLVFFTEEFPSFHISGYLSKPQLTSSMQNKIRIYVNRRRVHDLSIVDAIKNAYGTLLEARSYPIAILFIEVPFELVDVNIHPRKEKIAFQQIDIYQHIMKAVSNALAMHNLTFSDLRWQPKGKVKDTFKLNRQNMIHDGHTDTYAAQLLKDEVLSPTSIPISGKIIQILNKYIIVPTRNGFTVIDQHAAHERILYEKFMSSFNKLRKQNYQHILPKTIMLTLSPLEVTVMEKNTELFDQLGFEIELFGSNAYKVNAVPMIFKDRDIGQMIREILEDIATNKQPKDIDTVTQRMITFLACRSAIKAGDPLKDDQCQELIEELNALPGIYTCPHGRPIRIEWLSKDLDKLFYRL